MLHCSPLCSLAPFIRRIITDGGSEFKNGHQRQIILREVARAAVWTVYGVGHRHHAYAAERAIRSLRTLLAKATTVGARRPGAADSIPRMLSDICASHNK